MSELEKQVALAEAMEDGALDQAAAVARELHPADLAAVVNSLSEEEQQALFGALDRVTVAEVMEFLSAAEAEAALAQLPREDQQQLLDELPDDELVDLLQEVDEPRKEEYLGLLSDSKKAVSSDLLRFPENTAGGRMTTALATVRPGMTVREAIDSLREIQDSTEILSRIFVVDDRNRLLGKVRLRDLTFSKRSQLISDIMDNETIAVNAMADQEEAAQMVARYDLVALPVVDENLKLLGVVTHDDAIDILEEESTEDIERLSAITGDPGEQSYLKTPVQSHFRRRFFWIFPLALLAIISGLVIYSYEQVLDQVYLLVIYLPMVVAAGGNTGAQSATTVIRAMSLGEFTPTAFLEVVWKEARIGFLMGGVLGISIGLIVQFVMPRFIGVPDNVSLTMVASVVAIALTAQVTSSTLLGSLLPLMARACNLDPAVVASPAITTIVDATGLIIYLALAKVLIGL